MKHKSECLHAIMIALTIHGSIHDGKINTFTKIITKKMSQLKKGRMAWYYCTGSNYPVYTVLDIKRVENAFFHSMYIFSVILHAIDKQDIST